MKHLAAKILRKIKAAAGEVPEEVNSNIPDYKSMAEFC
jgi:hypothetical protein